MRRLSLILGAILLAVLLVREPEVPVCGVLDREEASTSSRAHRRPDLMHGKGAPRLQGRARNTAARRHAERGRACGASAEEAARTRGDFDAEWKEIMADMEFVGNYTVATVVFPENWLDELEQDSGTSPTVSGAPAR